MYGGFGCVSHYLDYALKMLANLGRNLAYGNAKERVLETCLMDEREVLPTEMM